jgi:biotin carboxylase
MRTVRVWLNHWFSTAYHIIELICRDDALNFYAIGSNYDEKCVYKRVCDEFYTEPRDESGERYVDFCLNFCRSHGVEVFAPRRGMLAIGERLREFDAMGTKVLVERDAETLKSLNDKARFYAECGKRNIGVIPPHVVVNTASEFEEAYRTLKTDAGRNCFKFSRDEGAASFHVIDDTIWNADGLWRNAGAKITYENALTMLKNAGRFPDLLLMPYLPGEEVSVDCLRTAHGDIVVPRYKSRGRTEEIRFDDEITRTCEQLMEMLDLRCPFNVQFKYEGRVPYLLEVNTRMSGGIQLSCLALGVNMPNIAVNQLLGIDKGWAFEKRNALVSYVETPVEVS